MEKPTVNQAAMRTLKGYRDQLSKQQYKTIRGQILAGDDTGAMKGLKKLLCN